MIGRKGTGVRGNCQRLLDAETMMRKQVCEREWIELEDLIDMHVDLRRDFWVRT